MAPRLLVAAQFVLLALWILSGYVISADLVGRLLQAVGAALAMWAFAWMIAAQGRMFRISPDPTGHSRLVVTGPYRWIRHPMYTSILLVVAPPVLASAAAVPMLGLLVLAAVLLAKSSLEERLLTQRFPEYTAYRERTWRLVPYLL